MSQKNETPILILSLLITVGLIAGGFWWFSKNGRGFNQNQANNSQPNNTGSNETSGRPEHLERTIRRFHHLQRDGSTL